MTTTVSSKNTIDHSSTASHTEPDIHCSDLNIPNIQEINTIVQEIPT